MNSSIRERVVRFGPNEALAGILTTPHESPGTVPFVVIVNAGIIHRVGPNRLYVDVARTVAALGYPVLRFDLAGLGDSAAMSGGLSLSESAAADVGIAFDYLATAHQARSFLVFGLCSGANYASMVAFADPRAVGVMLIDPTVARTRRSRLVHLSRRLRHVATWGALLTLRHPAIRRSLVRLRSVAVAQAAEGQSGQRSAGETTVPMPADIYSEVRRALDRGLQFMFVFTGGVNQVYNYRTQLFDLLPGLDFRGKLRLEYMPETDHTITDATNRRKVLAALCDWLNTSFPADRSTTTTTSVDSSGDSSVAGISEFVV